MVGDAVALDLPPTERRGDLEKDMEGFIGGDVVGRFPVDTRRKCLPEALWDMMPDPREDSEGEQAKEGIKSPMPLGGGLDILEWNVSRSPGRLEMVMWVYQG